MFVRGSPGGLSISESKKSDYSAEERTSGVQHDVLSRVLKLPAILDLRAAPAAGSATVAAQNVNGLKHDDVRGFEPLIILACSDFIEKF